MQSKTPTKISTYSPFRDFIKKFSRQTVALISFFVIMGIVIVALLAPFLIPYNPTVDVTNQYTEEQRQQLGDTSQTISFLLHYSDGSEAESANTPLLVESVNRRVANARGSRNSINVTAVTAGETLIRVSKGEVTSLLSVIVTASELHEPVITKLEAMSPEKPAQAGDRFQLDIRASLSDGSQLTDPEGIETVATAMTRLAGVHSTGGSAVMTAPVSGEGEEKSVVLSYESLDAELLEVDEAGWVTVLAEGSGRIRVTAGEVSTVAHIPVGLTGAPIEPVLTGISFEKPQVELIDIYKHQPPSSLHWFGTDHQNRDIFSRIVMGTRQTLTIGLVSVMIGAFLGTVFGLLAGYYGGWIETLLTRASDVLLAFPGVLLAIAVIAVLGPGIPNIIFAVAVFTVPIFIRIVRSSTLSVKNMTYVEAARSIGVKDHVIIFRHILPGTMSVIIVYLTMRIGTAIIIGAVLSYLGLGGDITAPEWGAMLNAAKDNSRNVFHPTLFPGLAIVITVLAFNLLGDGLRDALDPKLKD